MDLHTNHTGPSDYGGVANMELQFESGMTKFNISIPIVDDGALEEMEVFSVALTTATAGVTLAPNETLVQIIDDGNHKDAHPLTTASIV